MSNKGIKKINCPFCHNEFKADFWSIVRGDIDFKLKEMIINKEFELLICPECKKIFRYEETFIYIDPIYGLLVYVLPSNTENKEEFIDRMEKDYQSLKEALSREKSLNFKPIYIFGIEGLSEILIKDRDNEEETDVIIFIAKSMGFESKKIDPAFAREYNIPFSIPVPSIKNPDKKETLKICREIFKQNNNLKRLENFLNIFEKDEKREIPFY